jgi:hypothetical protein
MGAPVGAPATQNGLYQIRRRDMRINSMIYGFLVVAVFLGVILGFQATGSWSVSGKTTASGEQIQPSAMDVNTIKGWMTLEQVSSTFNVPLADILTEFNLSADTPPATPIKELESDLFSVTALRAWLQSRLQSADYERSKTPAPFIAP